MTFWIYWAGTNWFLHFTMWNWPLLHYLHSIEMNLSATWFLFIFIWKIIFKILFQQGFLINYKEIFIANLISAFFVVFIFFYVKASLWIWVFLLKVFILFFKFNMGMMILISICSECCWRAVLIVLKINFVDFLDWYWHNIGKL